jgi:hypothetical protein
MKVLVFVKATANSEKGVMPSDEQLTQMLADMGKFNDQLIKAGILKDADGLKPSSAGKRLTFSDQGHTAVIDGPFAETKELVAGYWIWTVKSMDEAVEWAKRCPNPMPGEEGVIEIRPAYSEEEFAALLTDEQRTQEKSKPKSKVAKKAKRMAKRPKARARSKK